MTRAAPASGPWTARRLTKLLFQLERRNYFDLEQQVRVAYFAEHRQLRDVDEIVGDLDHVFKACASGS
jgi:hypothetical protein